MEDIFPLLIPLVGVSIPLVIVAGRFIVQPIVDGLARVASAQAGSEQLEPLEKRLAMTESRLHELERTLGRIAEEQEFQSKMLGSRSAARLSESVRPEPSKT
jgi:hypothetical protein